VIAFVVPVHGRHRLATVCLRQLRRVCDQLGDATAVIVGDDENFKKLATELWFDFVYSANTPLGRKWNDGIYHAGARLRADYIVRIGSDDVVHPSLFDDLPVPGVTACTRYSAIVSPDASRIALLDIQYAGGDGVRVTPRDVYERLSFRPAMDSRDRAIDGSITQNLQLLGQPEVYEYRNTDPLAIIDFKTDTPDQRNSFESCLTFANGERTDVFEAVAEWHGEKFAADVAYVYGKTAVAA
jgi:hypothetical protein